MHKFNKIILLFVICFVLIGFYRICNRSKCLNLEEFEQFYYKDNLYVLPDDYDEISSEYMFYGDKHKVGYTIGFYSNVTATYVLDADIEENVLFQEYGFFWFKEGYQLPTLNKSNIKKLLIQKLDNYGDIITSKEFDLKNYPFENLYVDYDIDSNNDSFLLNINNFSRYRIKFIYDCGIISNFCDRFVIYNNKIYIETKNEFDERKICVLHEDYSNNLLDFVLSID